MHCSVRRLGITLVVLLALALGPLPVYRAAGVTPARPLQTQTVVTTELSVPEPPPISAAAAFVLDATAGTPLYALNPDERRPPASLTKVDTALVVLQHGNLDDEVVIEATDLADLSESQVGLLAGDSLTVRDLLYGLLLPSGNDAANALARHIGAILPGRSADPRAAFIAEMNQLATDLGLQNTHFTNPSGIQETDHYSSAFDLATITAKAMENETFATIVATPAIDLVSTIDPAQVYPIRNTNELLQAGAVTGVKTGTTVEAGGCLITSYSVGSNTIITVILGSPTFLDEAGNPKSTARFDDIRAISSTLPVDYRWVDPADSSVVPGLTDELAAWQARLESGHSVVLPMSRAADLRYRVVLGPPGPPNSQVGQVVFFLGADRLGQQPIYQVG